LKLAFSKPTRNDDDRDTLFSHFGSVGFDGLQLKFNQYSTYLDDSSRSRTEWAHLPGVASALICAGGLGDDGVRELRRVIAFAGEVEGDLVVFCHTVPREGIELGDIRGFARQLSEVGVEARDAGVKLSLHHHFDQPVMHWEDFEVFYDGAESGAVGLTVDTAHLVKSGIDDIAGLIRHFAPVIDNFHLKDYAEGEWRVLGRGEIDFAPVFDAIRGIGYNGWVSADEESGSDVLDGMRECFEVMKAGLG